jgi:hypothetical protein
MAARYTERSRSEEKDIDELIGYHFGLNLWIRNNRIYPTDEKHHIITI